MTRKNSKKGFSGTKNQHFLIFTHPDKKDAHLIDSGEDFELISAWLSESWKDSGKEIIHDNETIVVRIVNKTTLSIFIYIKDKCNFVECKDIVTYLREVSKLSNNRNLFYRGQASYYQWIPSLYRRHAWVENEAVLNAKVISRHVVDFQDCHTTIERLIKLKHFNQPSRLYDIVANPLMALYFACESGIKEKSDGMIALIYSDSNEEKYSVLSDTVIELSSLSNVARFQQLSDGLAQKKSCKVSNSEGVSREDCYYLQAETLQHNDYANEENNSLCKECGITAFLSELAHQCKKESRIESYWNDISLEKIDQCVVVHPELNNARIIQQQGLFILCGLNSKNLYEPPESLYDLFMDNGKRTYIHLSNQSLKKCCKELIRLGINRSQVYFDLEKTIEFERDRL